MVKTFETYLEEAATHPALVIRDLHLDHFSFTDTKLPAETLITIKNNEADTTIYKEDAKQIVKFLKTHFSI